MFGCDGSLRERGLREQDFPFAATAAVKARMAARTDHEEEDNEDD